MGNIYEKFRAALLRLIESEGRGAQARVAREANIAPSYVNDIVKGRKDGPEDKRRSIAKAFGLTYENMLDIGALVLDGAEPEIIGKIELLSGASNVESIQPTRSLVPLISWVRAGDWAEVVDPYHPGEAEEWIDTLKKYGKNTFALRVNGDSMSPRFPDGCIITVDPDCREENGSFVVAKINHDEATFKQLVSDGGRIYLKPLNERYPIMDVTGRDLHICGVVREKLVREEI